MSDKKIRVLEYLLPAGVLLVVVFAVWFGFMTAKQYYKGQIGIGGIHNAGEFGRIQGQGFCYSGVCYMTKYGEQVCFAPPIRDVLNYSKGKSLCWMVKDSCLKKEKEGYGPFRCKWDDKDKMCMCFVK